MRDRRGYLGAASVALLLLLPACGHYQVAGPCFICPTNNNDYVYTANSAGNSSTVSALASDHNSGAITAVSGSPFGDGGSGAVAIAVSSFAGVIYVANSTSGNISALTPDLNTGKLSAVSGPPFPAETGMDSIALDASGQFLYAVTRNSANLWAYSVSTSPNGALTPLPSIPKLISATENGSSSVIVDPSGTYVYVTTQTNLASHIYGFSRDSGTGALTALAGFPLAIDGLANKTAFDSAGKFLLVTGAGVFGLAGGIDIFSLNRADGSLTPVGSAVQTGADPAGIVFDITGKFVYVPNTGDVTISAFVFDGVAGTLTPVSGSPVPSGGNGNVNGPLAVAVAGTDRFLFVSNASNDVSVFSINGTDGSLSPIQGSPFPTGGNAPSAVLFVQ